MYFCAFQFPFHKKETTLTGIIYHQNDGIPNQHSMVYSSPLTLEKKSSCITHYYSISLSSDSLFEELIEGKYSLISVQP